MPQATIGVLGGTGQQGRGIAQRLARAGSTIVVGSRDPARAAAAVAEWPLDTRLIPVADYGKAIAESDIVILTIPFESVDAILDQHQQSFRMHALVVDVTVPLDFSGGIVKLSPVAEGSAALHIRARLPTHARLAVAFKTIPARVLNEIDRPLDCDEFVCGDSPEVRSEASALVETMEGLRAVDLGSLTRARTIEHFTLAAIAINRLHKVHGARFRVVGIS